eukprot:2291834-Pyramimonas_sp.AAC.1
MPTDALYETELNVNLGAITEDEVHRAARALKPGKAGGLDDLPPEFWRTATEDGSTALSWVTRFCNIVWESGQVPDDWHKSRVRMIYKKGDPAECDNYRPISLLPIGYKMFAIVLLRRLKHAGAEDRIWQTQFGFRSKRGTADAVFLARRVLEDAWSTRDGKVYFLALDWAKAFDS